MKRPSLASKSFPLAVILCAASMFASACDKEGASTTVPDDAAAAQPDKSGLPDGNDGEANDALPPQDPVPEAVMTAYNDHLFGRNEQARAALEGLGELDGDTQVLAGGMRDAVLALILVEDIPDTASDPATNALAAAERTGDATLLVVAHLAHGAYLTGVEHYPEAQAEIEASGATGEFKDLARLLLAEATLNQAFDGAERAIVHPEKLDEAATIYQGVADGPSQPIFGAHASEGLAAIANYKGDKAKVCEHVKAAKAGFEGAGADATLLEISSLLADKARCG